MMRVRDGMVCERFSSSLLMYNVAYAVRVFSRVFHYFAVVVRVTDVRETVLIYSYGKSETRISDRTVNRQLSRTCPPFRPRDFKLSFRPYAAWPRR